MYFDTLPSEILRTIIKYVFLETRSQEEEDLGQDVDKSPKRRQSILSLSMLVSDDSPFREAVSQLSLTQVQLGRISESSRLCVDSGVFVIGSDLFGNEGVELGMLERFLRLCGKSVRVVSFSMTSNQNDIVRNFTTLVKMYCTNVENLSFTSPTNEEDLHTFEYCGLEILEEFSSTLHSITWAVDWIESNKHYCRYPDISMCTSIRELHFPASPQLTSFLRTFGSSLERLTVLCGDVNGYPKMLDVIENNCTKLRTVLLFDCVRIMQIVGEERYVSVLSSFGSQLTCAAVEVLSLEKLARVVKECPNLGIASYSAIEGGVGDCERLGLLGPMIKDLNIEAHMCRDETCEEAVSKCRNLELLTIEEKYADEKQDTEKRSSDVTFLLSLSSSSLTYLHYIDFTATQHNIWILSMAFRSLDELTLDLIKPIESGIDFKIIAHSNPQLNSVCIEERIHNDEKREKDQTMEILRMLVSAFSKCHIIELFLANDGEWSVTQDEIQDVCGSLPCRGVHKNVAVGSTSFFVDGLIR